MELGNTASDLDKRFMRSLYDAWTGLLIEANRNGLSGQVSANTRHWIGKAIKIVSPSMDVLDVERMAIRLVDSGAFPVTGTQDV